MVEGIGVASKWGFPYIHILERLLITECRIEVRELRLFRSALKVSVRIVIFLVIAFLGLILLGLLLGVAVPFFAMSIVDAASDSFAAAQIPLSIWTGGAMLLAFLFRLYFLYRHRATHRLRLLEYPGSIFRPTVLTGGIAYGAITVMVTFAKGLLSEAELAKLSQSVPPVHPGVLLGILPLVVAMLAAYLTTLGILKSMPESEEPSKDEQDILKLWSFFTLVCSSVASFIICSGKCVRAWLGRNLPFFWRSGL